MTDLAEKTRLYQAELEEQRSTTERLDELIASEAVEAQQHIDAEVQRTRAAMETAWLERSYA